MFHKKLPTPELKTIKNLPTLKKHFYEKLLTDKLQTKDSKSSEILLKGGMDTKMILKNYYKH